MGAAIQAAVISGAQAPSVLVDVTPYTFGTSALGEYEGEMYPYCYVPLIRKNTPIPVSRSEVFHTVHDGQKKVEVNVYQGEDPDALNNISIGRFLVEGLRDAPAGNPVVTTFSLDLNGILHVSAREKETGLQHSITIDRAISRFSGDKLNEARERIAAIFADQEDDAAPAASTALPVEAASGDADETARRLRVEARALIEKGERLLATASGEDADDLVNGIESVKEAITGSSSELKAAIDVFADLLYYLDA